MNSKKKATKRKANKKVTKRATTRKRKAKPITDPESLVEGKYYWVKEYHGFRIVQFKHGALCAFGHPSIGVGNSSMPRTLVFDLPAGPEGW